MNDEPGRTVNRTVTPSDEVDRDVLVRVAAGQLDALQDLYDRYKTMAYSIALRITADASLAEDVVQDAFLGAWRNAERYVDARGSVKTWLMAIVHHRAVETWVIVEGVDPLAVGGFTVNRNGVASFTTRPADTPAGAVIALTLEPNANNTVPMGPLVSKGVTTPLVGLAGTTAAR